MSDVNHGLKWRGLVLCLLIFSGIAFVSPLLLGDWLGSVAGAPTGSMFSYVVNIWMENKNYGSVLSGNTCCPYENSLANTYSTDTNYGSITSPSLPNYLGFLGGSYPSCATGDGDPSSCNAGGQTNLVDRLESAGLTWKAYAENYPVTQGCTTAGSSGSWYARHFPFNYYSDITGNGARCSNLLDAGSSDSRFLSALNTTSSWPNFVWLTPNGCNDTHDCGASTGDTYLAGLVPKILNSNMFKTGEAVLVITWDEYNPAPDIEASCCVKLAFKSSLSANHYSWLKTLESNWGLSSLTTNDANAPVLDMFTTGTVGGAFTGSFSFSPSGPTVGQTVTFTGSGSGGTPPYTFKWGFGDGQTGTGNPATHSYSVSGNYIASLTLTDSASGSFTAPTQTLTVSSQQVSTGNFNSSWYLSYSSPSSATLSNGIVTETVSDTCTGFNGGCAYWSTAQWGTPCCPAPYYDSSGNLVAPVVVNASYVSASGKFESVTTSGSTWHWSYYMGLYFQMSTALSSGGITSRIIDGQIIIGKCDSSSGCASGGTSYTSNLGNRFGYREIVSSPVETAGNSFQLPSSSIWTFYQHALTAWGLPSNTKAVLFRVEPGAEGYGISPFTVTWYTTNITRSNSGAGSGQNHPPSLSVPSSVTATPGARIAFVVNATDPDVGETIALTAARLPSGASFDQSMRQFLWSPTASDLGSYNVTFTATDNGSPPMSSAKSVLIIVQQAAQPPPSQPKQGPGVCFQCLLTPTTLTSLWLVTTAGLVGLTGMIGVFYLKARARLAAARRMRRLNRRT